MAIALLIDDDRSIRHVIAGALRGLEVELQVAATAKQGLDLFALAQPDVILLDVMLPDASGLELCQEIHRLNPKIPIIIITAGGTSETAIQAMKLGAYDFLLKPLDVAKVSELIRQAVEISRVMSLPVKFAEGEVQDETDEQLVGRTPQMQAVYKTIGRVAHQDVAVLIRGESGSGKELVARAIYHHSRRADKVFLAVNCAALTESLLESELFGHEKGAFTGATSQRIGKFEQCSGGTLFLDEVGDMSPLLQSKVLRILQEQRFERVGGTETIQTDVRIITATNRDLESMVAKGEFREDLYYRLNGFTVRIPPLRERRDDIPLLVELFLQRFRREMNKDVHAISPEALELFVNYRWPGNIRQLQNVLRHAIVQSSGPVLIAEFFPGEMSAAAGQEDFEPRQTAQENLDFFVQQRLQNGTKHLYAETIEAVEKYLISTVLNETNGNQSKAAIILGITRGCLRHKIRLYGIALEHQVTLRENPAETTAGEFAPEC